MNELYATPFLFYGKKNKKKKKHTYTHTEAHTPASEWIAKIEWMNKRCRSFDPILLQYSEGV